jgi:Zn-dependent M28 family amino/carboxypeptidase
MLYPHAGDDRGNGHDPITGDLAASAQLKAARAAIYSHFQALGLDTSYDHYRPSVLDFGMNVIGELRGTLSPDEIIIVGGHYDSVGNPGACDNASGTATVMELASVLSKYGFERTIRFIRWDEEESGHVGSQAYTEVHQSENIILYFNLDGIGQDRGSHRVRVGSQSESNRPLMVAYIAFLAAYSPQLTAMDSIENDNSDHNEFQNRGIPNFELYSYDYIEYSLLNFHSAADNVDEPGQINYEFGFRLARAGAAFLAVQAKLVAR